MRGKHYIYKYYEIVVNPLCSNVMLILDLPQVLSMSVLGFLTVVLHYLISNLTQSLKLSLNNYCKRSR